MSKKVNLATALHEISGKKKLESLPTLKIEDSGTSNSKLSSRMGKKVIAGHFDPAVLRQLKILAMNQDSSIQRMLSEALNDLFEKYDLNPIA